MNSRPHEGAALSANSAINRYSRSKQALLDSRFSSVQGPGGDLQSRRFSSKWSCSGEFTSPPPSPYSLFLFSTPPFCTFPLPGIPQTPRPAGVEVETARWAVYNAETFQRNVSTLSPRAREGSGGSANNVRPSPWGHVIRACTPEEQRSRERLQAILLHGLTKINW